MKFKIMIINIKLKATIKLGASEMMCIEMRAQKLRNVQFALMYVYVNSPQLCDTTLHTLTVSLVNEFKDDDY